MDLFLQHYVKISMAFQEVVLNKLVALESVKKSECEPCLENVCNPSLEQTCRLGGVVVSVLATGSKVYGFEPGQGDGFLRAIKIRSTPSSRM
jgi:hypothetical protein